MVTNNYYRAYTMEYGTFVGLCWSAFFLSYVYGLVQGSVIGILLCFAFCAFSFVLPFGLATRLSRRVSEDGGKLSYWQGLIFSFSMFMYACLMNGLIIFAYFELIDGGSLVNTLIDMLSLSDIKSMYTQMGLSSQYKEVIDMLDEVAGLGSFEKTLLLFNNNFTWGIFMSFLVAIPASWKHKIINK